MTTSKQALREKIDTLLDMEDAEGLRATLELLKDRIEEHAGNYLLFARDVFVDRTRDLSKKPMSIIFKDAIIEALSIMPSPKEIREVKEQARIYHQTYVAKEVETWPRQYMLAYRTKVFYNHNHDAMYCKICNEYSNNQVIMLNIGLQAGPFCKKCLRRIPRSWYCQK